MKFLITMNMPSGQGYLVHQITIDHNSEDLADFCDALNDHEFIIGRLMYRRQNDQGIWVWLDKNEIVINTAHVGKAQTFIEYGANDDDLYGNTETGSGNGKLARGPIRPRR